MTKIQQSRFRQAIDGIILFHNSVLNTDIEQWKTLLETHEPEDKDNLDLETFTDREPSMTDIDLAYALIDKHFQVRPGFAKRAVEIRFREHQRSYTRMKEARLASRVSTLQLSQSILGFMGNPHGAFPMFKKLFTFAAALAFSASNFTVQQFNDSFGRPMPGKMFIESKTVKAINLDNMPWFDPSAQFIIQCDGKALFLYVDRVMFDLDGIEGDYAYADIDYVLDNGKVEQTTILDVDDLKYFMEDELLEKMFNSNKLAIKFPQMGNIDPVSEFNLRGLKRIYDKGCK